MSASTAVYRANPRAIPSSLSGLCTVLLGIGVVSFVAGLVVDPATAWIAYHVNFIYWAAVSQGAVVVACALVIVGAGWAGPVRHVAEIFAAWTPITFLLGIFGIFGGEYIFANWWYGAPPPKDVWLTPGRLYTTDLAILGLLAFLSVTFLRTSLRPALGEAARSAPRAQALFARWTKGWQGAEAEWEASQRKLRVLAPMTALAFAFGYGLFGLDQVMSLEPSWFSTIFPWYFAWGGFLCGVAVTALACVALRGAPGWGAEISKARLHDLGKMVFAFSIFWMYLFFAQYLVIWYGNLPEETQFFQLRLGSQFLQDTWTFSWSRFDEPYVKLSLVAWLGVWVVPFWVLLGQAAKRNPAVLGTVSAIVMLGFWLERNALVWPSLRPEDGSSWLGPIQIGIALGFLGGFMLVYLTASRVFPTLPLPERSARRIAD